MRDRKVTGMERICGTCFYDERMEDLGPCKSCKEYGNWLPRIKEKPEQNPVQNADPQDAKADAGKIDMTNVDTMTLYDISKIKEYDQAVIDGIRAEMLYKTERKNGYWYGMFRCPFCGKEFETMISNAMKGKVKSFNLDLRS